MTTRYQKSQIEDVARILAYHDSQCRPVAPANSGKHRPMMAVAKSFANLFAADNPDTCRYCGATPASAKVRCVGHEGDPFHNFEGGFDRERFLAACGLESEGNA